MQHGWNMGGKQWLRKWFACRFIGRLRINGPLRAIGFENAPLGTSDSKLVITDQARFAPYCARNRINSLGG